MCKNCLRQGYTLIEILVAISLTLIMAWGGITYYNSFSRRQKVQQAVEKIVSDIRLAKSLALSQQKPADCDTTLKAYVFEITSDASYQIVPECEAGLLDPTKEVFLEGVSLSGTLSTIRFEVLTQAVSLLGLETEGNLSVSSLGGSYSRTVNINAGGGDIKIE